jgi:DNA ligase-1
MRGFAPILAGKADPGLLRFPLLASPKLDGIRCLITEQGPVTRKLKPVPNKRLREFLASRPELIGLDGELIFGSASDPNAMQATSSAVMSHDGPLDVKFYVFDDFTSPSTPFVQRLELARTKVQTAASSRVVFLEHHALPDSAELEAYEALQVEQGFEGVMLRDMWGDYKFGRSTPREGLLLKLKRFDDAEAQIVDFVAWQTNNNPKERDALGHAKRSSAQAGKQDQEALGALVLKSPEFETEFNCGTGFTWEQRQALWAQRESLRGKTVTFKFQPHGVKVAPRCPVFKGFRHEAA